jgi:glycosyltransferase involved in cell wall biosynthesis
MSQAIAEQLAEPAGVASDAGLRILRVADVPESATAGMSGFMLSSAAEMTRNGHEVTFWFRDQLLPRLEHGGFRRLVIPWLILLRVLAALRAGERYDVVEIHEPLSAPYSVAARILRAWLPICAVLSFGLEERYWQARHASLAQQGRRVPLRSRILVPVTLLSQARVGLLMAGTVLVPSSVDREYLIARLRIPARRVTCAFTGVSGDLFDLAPQDRQGVRFLFLGSWIERKGNGELITAWRRLIDQHPEARLTLAGVGPLGEDVRAIPGIEVVPFISREELAQLLQVHDVFVLPSWFEGLPLAMLEAAAAGLACVVCAICGNLDVFRPDYPARDGGILIDAHDSEALHDALVALLEDASLRHSLGVNAKARARAFTWARTAEQSLVAYEAAISRAGRRPTSDTNGAGPR